MNNANNNPSQIDPSLRIIEVFPSTERTSITVYDDDGKTDAYLAGASLTYQVEQQLKKGRAVITIHPAEGKGFEGMTTEKRTRLIVNMASQPKKVTAKVNGKAVKVKWSYGTEAEMARIGIKRPQQLIVEIPETSIYFTLEVISERTPL